MRIGALLVAFALAVALRSAVAGPDVRTSLTAGLVFAGCLLALALAAGTRMPVTRKALGYGVAGAIVICLPASLEHVLSGRPLHGTDGFLRWALVVTAVAAAEEVFLRGALHEAVAAVSGELLAVIVGAIGFALLHVPLYGWEAVPLDLAVGLVLGGLRTMTGTPVAPAVSHVGADFVGWFIR
jgi:membrane protease YdiL (CAAX protease family)